MRITAFLLLLGSVLLASCDKTLSAEEQLKEDIELIQKYLSDNKITAQSTPSGLHYNIGVEGNGGNPTLQATVTVKYKGYLLDGTVFDQTKGTETATFPLKNLIKGWQESIPLLKKGGKGTFYTPSGLAYGPQGVPGAIPGNAVLIFDIELVDFK